MSYQIKLTKKPKNPILIEGFPGFGLVGTIANEFLIDHLKTERIGSIIMEEMPALVAIHESKVVQPLGIFYSKKYNLVFLHAVTGALGLEWKLSEIVLAICKQLNVKEIISLEGVGSTNEDSANRVFFYASDEKISAKFKKIKVEQLKEGIIIGVTGALLIKESMPMSCIFAETPSNLPDSKAAARVVEVLDRYLGLNVDSKPLLEQAEKFEEKLKNLMVESQKAQEMSEKKKLSYMG